MNTGITTETPQKVQSRSLFYARRADGTPYTFKHQGRTFRLFKRLDTDEAPYYFTFELDRRRHCPCLHTNQREAAVQVARGLFDAAWRDAMLVRTGQAPVAKPAAIVPVASIGAIEDAFARIAPENHMRPLSIANALSSLRRIIRRGLGETIPRHRMSAEAMAPILARVRAQSSTILNGALVKKFQAALLAPVAGQHWTRQQSTLVSLNAELSNARLIFSADMQRQLRRAGLQLPDLDEFINEPTAQPTDADKPKPSADLLRKTFEASEQLAQDDPNAYVAFRLACRSLRRGDIGQARRDWIQLQDISDDTDLDAPVSQGWFLTWPMSKGARWHRIALPEEEARLYIAHWEREQPERSDWERDYLISAGTRQGQSREYRAGLVFERVYAWMRSLGWTTPKLLHEMRAYYARRKKAAYLEAAQAAERAAGEDLGHRGGTRGGSVTQKHYLGADTAGQSVVVPFPGRKKVA